VNGRGIPVARVDRAAFRRHGVAVYLLLVFGIAWPVWIAQWALHMSKHDALYEPLLVLGAFAPAVAAFVVRFWVTREGVGDRVLKLRLRRAWRYYVFAWLWPLPLGAVALLLAAILGVHVTLSWEFIASFGLAIILVPALFGEEFGWRGYLQPRLLRDRPALAAVAVGLIWGVWHYPIVLSGYEPNHHGLRSVLLYAWFMVPFSVILGWLQQRTRTVWVATLAHSSANSVLPKMGSALALGTVGYGDLLYMPRAYLFVVPFFLFAGWLMLTGRLDEGRPRPLLHSGWRPHIRQSHLTPSAR
jgi:membrane protease YdiL (CAAX protease family)